jgi:D-alanyl-D-alanine dipeptidase
MTRHAPLCSSPPHSLVRAISPSAHYGLLIHDAYRPWYVTKILGRDAADKRWLVANPPRARSVRRRGRRSHAFEIATGRPVVMPSTYDESTDRAFANYPGGTSLQRWHRALLRRAMEAQGFAVNPTEWWHFDFNRWRDYPIGNVAFNRIARSGTPNHDSRIE